MSPSPSASFWDGVRAWADSLGLLVPQPTEAQERPRPTVPQSVCDSCPICQAAATADQIDPQVFTELIDVARSVLVGMGTALASAAEQRLATSEPVSPPAPGAARHPGVARDQGAVDPGVGDSTQGDAGLDATGDPRHPAADAADESLPPEGDPGDA